MSRHGQKKTELEKAVEGLLVSSHTQIAEIQTALKDDAPGINVRLGAHALSRLSQNIASLRLIYDEGLEMPDPRNKKPEKKPGPPLWVYVIAAYIAICGLSVSALLLALAYMFLTGRVGP